MKPILTILFIIIGLVLLIPKISAAGNVYNFYFNQEEEPVVVSGGKQTPSLSPSKALVPSYDAPSTPNVVANNKDPNRFRGFRLGVAFNVSYMYGAFDPEYVPQGAAAMPGATFSVKLFPIRYLGFFGEATIGGNTVRSFQDLTNLSNFSKLFYNFGAEIVPVRISLFGADNLIDLAGEIGFSTLYFAYYKSGSSNQDLDERYSMLSKLGYSEFQSGLFVGPKIRINFGPSFSLETMMRMGLLEDNRNVQFLAGATLNF